MAGEIELPPTRLLIRWTRNNWLARGQGIGRRNTAFTIEKIAVLAPMPKANVKTATAVKPGERHS
jgi:hypothetical protein